LSRIFKFVKNRELKKNKIRKIRILNVSKPVKTVKVKVRYNLVLYMLLVAGIRSCRQNHGFCPTARLSVRPSVCLTGLYGHITRTLKRIKQNWCRPKRFLSGSNYCAIIVGSKI